MVRPLLLHYYVTTRCNARCSFCGIWKEPAGPDASLADVTANLAHARRAGCSFVDFTGGEPLLNPQLPLFLREAKKAGYITSITTNCLLFPRRAKELAGLIDLLHFSIDGDTPERHDALRGRQSFSSVIESIDSAMRNDLIPDLLFTYTDENIGWFDGVYRLARRKKLMVVLDPVFGTREKDTLSARTHSMALDYSRRKGVYLNRAHLTLRRLGGNRTDAPFCRAVSSTVVILPDNTLALPCFHHRAELVPINNNLDEILSGVIRKNAEARQGRYPFCEHCHLNCYFDPSYGYLRNRMLVQSMAAKLRYAWRKYAIYRRKAPRVIRAGMAGFREEKDSFSQNREPFLQKQELPSQK